MNLADIQWFYILTSFLLGGVLGAFVYRLMNANATQNTKIRHQLTERELELNQVRESLNDHFSRTASSISTLSKQLQTMESQLLVDADQLCSDESVIKRLTGKPADSIDYDNYQPPRDYASDKEGGTLSENFQQPKFEPPRDYASDKARGTLSENFGLKPEVFEPKR